MSKKSIIDLKNLNLNFEINGKIIKLISLKTSSMTLEIEVYEKENLLEKSTMVFAQLPKKLKSRLNPLK